MSFLHYIIKKAHTPFTMEPHGNLERPLSQALYITVLTPVLLRKTLHFWSINPLCKLPSQKMYYKIPI